MPTTFAVGIDENPLYATRAEQDKNGDQIDLTYAKKSEVNSVPDSTSADSGKVLTVNASGKASWEELPDTSNYDSVYATVESCSGDWENGYDIVNASADLWTSAASLNEYPVSGGTGIEIEDVSGTIVISSNVSGGISSVTTTSNLRGDGSSSDPIDLNSVIDIGGYPETSHHTFINDMGVVSGLNIAPEYYGWAITPISGLTIHTKYDDEGTTGPNNYLQGRDIIALHGMETSASTWNEGYELVTASGDLWTSAANLNEYPVSGGAGIDIHEVSGTIVISTDIPAFTSLDNGKVLGVVNGALAWVSLS